MSTGVARKGMRVLITLAALVFFCNLTVFVTTQDPHNLWSNNDTPSGGNHLANSYEELDTKSIWEKKSPECRSGHLSDWTGHCHSGCLVRLPRSVVNESLELDVNTLRGAQLASEPVHVALLITLTRLQRRFHVLGAVGFFGESASISSLLWRLLADRERLVVAASHNARELVHTLERDRIPTHEADRPTPQVAVHLYSGSLASLDKSKLQRWLVPQFRLVVIEATSSQWMLLQALEKIACIARDGFILALPYSQDSLPALTHFFWLHAPYFRPLLLVANVIYVCQTSWYDVWATNLEQYITITYRLKSTSTTRFGQTFTYLIAAR